MADDQPCQHGKHMEKRLDRGEQKFDQLMDELHTNNRNIASLLTQNKNLEERTQNLEEHVYGKNGNNGLLRKMARVQAGLYALPALATVAGGIYAIIEIFKLFGDG